MPVVRTHQQPVPRPLSRRRRASGTNAKSKLAAAQQQVADVQAPVKVLQAKVDGAKAALS